MDILENKLGWKYGGKHHESVTRWYQGHFLPNKFSIDKRYIHFQISLNEIDKRRHLLR